MVRALAADEPLADATPCSSASTHPCSAASAGCQPAGGPLWELRRVEGRASRGRMGWGCRKAGKESGEGGGEGGGGWLTASNVRLPGWSCASQMISSVGSMTEKQCDRPRSSGSIARMSAKANLRSARSLASGMRPGGKISKPRAETLQNSCQGTQHSVSRAAACSVGPGVQQMNWERTRDWEALKGAPFAACDLGSSRHV